MWIERIKREIKAMAKYFFVLLFSLTVSVIGYAEDINDDYSSQLLGVWKHAEDPLWVQLSFNETSVNGVITQNDDDDTSVGKTLLDKVVYDSDERLWSGLIYVPQLKRMHPMTLRLIDHQRFKITVKVGFIKRSVEFFRAAEME